MTEDDNGRVVDTSPDGLRIVESGSIEEIRENTTEGVTRRPVRMIKPVIDMNAMLEEMGRGIVGSPGRIDRIRGVPHEFDFNLYEALYKTESLIFRGINITADHVIQPGFNIEGGSDKNRELVREWSEYIGLSEILYDMVRAMLIWGNAFTEIVTDKNTDWGVIELKPIPPSTMYVYRKETGDIIGYIQIPKTRRKIKGYSRPLRSIPHSTQRGDLTTEKKRGWAGQVRASGAVPFEPDQVIHVKLNDMPSSEYGLSVIEPMMSPLTIYQGMRVDIGVISRRYAAPRTIWLLGDEQFPAHDQMMDDFHRYMDSLNIGDDIVIPAWISFEVLGAGEMTMDVKPYLSMLRDDVFAGLSVPEILMGGTVKGTLASATIQLESFSRRVRVIQGILSNICRKEIFPHVIGVEPDGGFLSRKQWSDIPKITFRPMMTAEELHVMARDLFDSNVISREESRRLLSMADDPDGHMALEDQIKLVREEGKIAVSTAAARPTSTGGSPTSAGKRGPKRTTGAGGDDKSKSQKPTGDKTKKQGGNVGT